MDQDLARKVGCYDFHHCERIQYQVTRLCLSCPELEDSSMGALVRLVRSVPRVILFHQKNGYNTADILFEIKGGTSWCEV